MSGFSLQPQALDYLIMLFSDSLNKQLVDLIIETISPKTQSKTLDQSIIESTVQDLSSKTESLIDPIECLAAKNIPRHIWDSQAHQFRISQSENDYKTTVSKNLKVHPISDAWLQLYHILFQQTLLYPRFTKESLDSTSSTDFYTLLSVKSALNTTSNIWVFGQLQHPRPNLYYIRDPTGSLQLDFSTLEQRGGGFFTDFSFVILNGNLQQRLSQKLAPIFQVTQCAFPPIISNSTSKALYQSNISGLHSEEYLKSVLGKSYNNVHDLDPIPGEFSQAARLHLNSCRKALQLAKMQESFCILLAQPHFDDVHYVKQFESLLQSPPSVMVIFGNLSGKSLHFSDTESFSLAIRNLAAVVKRYPQFCLKTRLVIVPGPEDPPFPNILPKSGILKSLIQPLIQVVPNTTLMSNPARMSFYGQNWMLFRYDILQTLLSNTILQPHPNDPDSSKRHLVFSLLSQSTLFPMNPSKYPQVAKLQHSLRLFPKPDVLFLADTYSEYSILQNDVFVVNVPPFYQNLTFVVYYPFEHRCDFCIVDN